MLFSLRTSVHINMASKRKNSSFGPDFIPLANSSPSPYQSVKKTKVMSPVQSFRSSKKVAIVYGDKNLVPRIHDVSNSF